MVNRIARFQGHTRKQNYFEGWYFKCVSVREAKSLAVIAGVSMAADDRHAFVQVVLAPAGKVFHQRYPIEVFESDPGRFRVHIANNRFGEDGMHLYLPLEGGGTLLADLAFSNHTDIRRNLYMPTIMGPLSHLPRMQCNHGVVSMAHAVNGTLTHNAETVLFDGDRGYIEKDWGRSFPKRYIWMSCNHFSDAGTRLVFSLAHVPVLGTSMDGHFCVLQHAGREIRFATYLGSKVSVHQADEEEVRLELRGARHVLSISARPTGRAVALKSPRLGAMQDTIRETLGAQVDLCLRARDGSVLMQDQGRFAALENQGGEGFS